MSTATAKIKTPELDKMSAVRDRSQAIGEFLEWLQGEKGVRLTKPHVHTDSCFNHGLTKREFRAAYKDCSRVSPTELQNCRFDRPRCHIETDHPMPFHFTIETLLAEYFEIDLNKVERERQKILASLRG